MRATSAVRLAFLSTTLVVTVLLGRGLPGAAAATDPSPSPGMPAATWPPDEDLPSLEAAIDFRASFGLRADPEYVARSLVDATAFPEMSWSVPLSPEEAEDMRARLAVQDAVVSAIPSVASLRGYAGTYIDQLRGGLTVFLFTERLAEHQVRIAALLPGIEYEVRQVEATLAELTALKEAITVARDDLADDGIEIVSVSIDVKANRVEVGVIGPAATAKERLAMVGGPIVVEASRHELDGRADANGAPFRRLWGPLDPGDIPFRYSCGEDLTFTTSDLAAARPSGEEGPELATAVAHWGERVSDRSLDWFVVSREDDRVLALAPTGRRADVQILVSSPAGWEFSTGGGPCEPGADLGEVGVGRWRLDPRFPPPGPRTRTLRLLCYLGCSGTEKAGRAW